MSAVITSPSEADRRSSSSSRRVGLSHGRGGAGNMGPPTAADMEPVDLETPYIKRDVYTTGRGGRGNMAKNMDPAEARRAQDITAPIRHESESSTHVGRGGAANVFRPSTEGSAATKQENGPWGIEAYPEPTMADARNRDREYMGLADKGKEWLLNKMRRS